MENKAIPYLDTYPPISMMYFTVAEVMIRRVVSIPMIVKYCNALFTILCLLLHVFRVSDVLYIIKHTKHGGYPVTMKDEDKAVSPYISIIFMHTLMSTTYRETHHTMQE
jgi:hypothetical protein